MNFWNKNRNNDRINSLSKSLYGDDNVLLIGGVSKNDNDDYNSRLFSNYYDDNNIKNNQNTNDNSGGLTFSQGAGLMNKFGIGSSGGGTPWGTIASGARSGYDAITGKDAKDYSDLEQSTIYPVQGAAMGSQFGPWGAAGGALYGLGYSLKDNIGLKDNDWLTTVLLPIGMGDEHEGLIQL